MNQTMGSAPPPQQPPRPRGRPVWIPLAPVALAAGFLAVLVFSEKVLKIPVMIRPLSGAVTDTNVYLYWNPIRGDQVAYHAQIDASGPDFQDVIHEWGEGHDWVKARVPTGQIRVQKRNALKPGREYFWRVRSVVNGHPRPWSRAVAFRTREEQERRE